MQNDFDPLNIKQAKNILLKDLEVAEHIHTMQKEQQKAAIKKTSLWNRIKSFFLKRF
jgi:hypothetical protein